MMIGDILSNDIFYVKIKSFYKLYDTCCSQKLQNDENPTLMRHKYVKNVSSPYNVFNLVAMVNMSEKNTSRFMGCHGNHLQLIRNKTSIIQCTPGSQIYLSSKKIILEQKNQNMHYA